MESGRRIRGVFIGIDRYQSPEIRELRYAERDATALHALFADTFTYDADFFDLEKTCIPLDQLTEWFKAIPVRQLVCILDSCFSGAMGAKVLQLESMPRKMLSESSLLDQLAGEGRLILTGEEMEHFSMLDLGHPLWMQAVVSATLTVLFIWVAKLVLNSHQTSVQAAPATYPSTDTATEATKMPTR